MAVEAKPEVEICRRPKKINFWFPISFRQFLAKTHRFATIQNVTDRQTIRCAKGATDSTVGQKSITSANRPSGEWQRTRPKRMIAIALQDCKPAIHHQIPDLYFPSPVLFDGSSFSSPAFSVAPSWSLSLCVAANKEISFSTYIIRCLFERVNESYQDYLG